MAIKVFYFFPYKRFPTLLYSDDRYFASTIFRSLFFKLFPNSTALRMLRDWTFPRVFLESIWSVVVTVPNERIQLVYKGYDRTLYFEFDHAMEIVRLWTNAGESFTALPFLGYPIYFDYTQHTISAIKPLENFLATHWTELKNGAPLHGDLTHFNVLFDSKSQIHLIDRNPQAENSLISDHFYFYGYLLLRCERYGGLNDKDLAHLRYQLDGIYQKIFAADERAYLRASVEQIRFENYGEPAVEKYVEAFLCMLAGDDHS